jgi:hypothetical protein
MPQIPVDVLSSAQSAGTNLVSFTTAASLLPSQAKCTIPADDWWIGRTLRITAAGRISNVVTAQPTFTLSVNLGATSVWSGGAMLCSTTAHTTVPWWFELLLTCRAVGATASLMGQGWFMSRAVLDSGATADSVTTGHPALLVPETTPAVGATFDSNAPLVLDFLAACSVSNASNAIQLEQYELVG